MSYTGKVRNGVIVLPPDVHLADGQEVEVRLVAARSDTELVLREVAEARPPVTRLPDDLSVNLDYYLHGQSRKQVPRRNRWIARDTPAPEVTDHQSSEHLEKVRAMAADTRNLPADLSTNHDHYLHGLPRR